VVLVAGVLSLWWGGKPVCAARPAASKPVAATRPVSQPVVAAQPVPPVKPAPVAQSAPPVVESQGQAQPPKTLRMRLKPGCNSRSKASADFCFWFGSEEDPWQLGPYWRVAPFSRGKDYARVQLDDGSERYIDTRGALIPSGGL